MRLKKKRWEEIYEIGKGRAEDQNLKIKGWGIEKAMFTKWQFCIGYFFTKSDYGSVWIGFFDGENGFSTIKTPKGI